MKRDYDTEEISLREQKNLGRDVRDLMDEDTETDELIHIEDEDSEFDEPLHIIDRDSDLEELPCFEDEFFDDGSTLIDDDVNSSEKHAKKNRIPAPDPLFFPEEHKYPDHRVVYSESERTATGEDPALKRKKLRRDILVTTFVFITIFLGMIAYLAFFAASKAEEYRANIYNAKRQNVLTKKYTRGDIITADGKVAATTEKDEEGNEKRVYPYGSLFAHTVGYSTYGSTGVESLASSYLMSSHINLIDEIRTELDGKKIKGDSAVLTLRYDLQKAAYDALGDNRGAIVVTEVKTGKILAMVSKPDFDPNEIQEKWEEMTSDRANSSLVNRAAQGKYPPGSTFKIITALEYIRENPDTWEDFTFDCDSVYESEGYEIKCSKGKSHGNLTLKTAFAESCNGAFCYISGGLDIAALYSLCKDLGYNRDFNIGLLINPSSYVMQEGAKTWDILQTSIGQGETVVTPMLNCMIASAVANRGVMVTPYIVDCIRNSYGAEVKTYASDGSTRVMSEKEAEVLGTFMREVVTEGTGDEAQGEGYTVAGKTGSAEWAAGKDTHAWFVGFAPYEKPEIAISVIVEQGGSGGTAAAPAARAVFDAYFN